MIKEIEYSKEFKDAERACEKDTVALVRMIRHDYMALNPDGRLDDFTAYVFDKDTNTATETVIIGLIAKDDGRLDLMTYDGRKIGIRDCHEGTVAYLYHRVHQLVNDEIEKRNERNYIPVNKEPELIEIRLTPEKTPVAYENKVGELVSDGMDREKAEKFVKDSVFELELYYEKDNGLFGVDPSSLEGGGCWSPYTQKEVKHPQDNG